MRMSENVGHDVIFRILKDDAQKIFCQSNTRLENDPLTRNLRIDLNTIPAFVKSRQDTFADDDIVSTVHSTIPEDINFQAEDSMPNIETSDLVGRSFLVRTPKDIQTLRVNIVKALEYNQDDLNSNRRDHEMQ